MQRYKRSKRPVFLFIVFNMSKHFSGILELKLQVSDKKTSVVDPRIKNRINDYFFEKDGTTSNQFCYSSICL